ncbi:MAG: hypothetical protein V1866_04285 [archaeon]
MTENLMPPESETPKGVSFNEFIHHAIIETIRLLETAEAKMSNNDAKKILKTYIEHARKKLAEEHGKTRVVQPPKTAPEKDKTPGGSEPVPLPKVVPITEEARKEIANAVRYVEDILAKLSVQKEALITKKIPGSSALGWLDADVAVKILENLALIKNKLKEKPRIIRSDGTTDQFENFVGNEAMLIYLLMVLAIHKGKVDNIPPAFREENQFEQARGMFGDARYAALVSMRIDEAKSILDAFIQRLQDRIDRTRKQLNIIVANPRSGYRTKKKIKAKDIKQMKSVKVVKKLEIKDLKAKKNK